MRIVSFGKKKRNLLPWVFFLLALLMAVPAHGGKIIDQDALFMKALDDGLVRVIVTIDVKNYKNLLAASEAFKVGEESQHQRVAVEAADAALANAIETSGVDVVSRLTSGAFDYHHSFKVVPALVMSVSPETLSELATLPQVVSVMEDVATPLPMPDKVDTPAVDSPKLNDSTLIVGADDAWAQGFTGRGWYVAILDSGVLTSHEFFSGKHFYEACFNTNTTGSGYVSSTVCPNNQESQTGTGAAAPPNIDGAYHGTHVAGIATGYNASPTTGEASAGVAKDADVVAVNVFSRFDGVSACGSSDPCVLSWSSDQILGLEHVYSLRSQINIASANMSLGGGQYFSNCDSDTRKTAVDALKAVGIATAIATGNEYYCGSIGAPACISSAVAVGSTNKSDVRSDYSNWEPTLQDLFAPGESILSSLIGSDTDYGILSGTSMATPHVAGAWAIMRQAYPTASVDNILSWLQSSGQTINVTNCSTTTGTSPRIDLAGPIPDGTPDLAWKNAATDDFGVETYNGTTRLAWNYFNRYADYWQIRGMADYNGDGHMDLLWRNANNGWFGWETYNGTTRLAFTLIKQNSIYWDIRGVGDFDHDGNLDILWRNSANGNFGWETYQGTTMTGWYWLNRYHPDWDIRGVGDFNGDGSVDLLWRHSTTGRIGWETYNGSTLLLWNAMGTYNVNWDIRGTADFNKDGSLDLFWRNSSTGAFGWQTYNGTTLLGWDQISVYNTNWDVYGIGYYD